MGTQSGVVGAIFNDGLKAVQAWVTQTNASGGLHCRPVSYVLVDDGGDTARHQAAVRKLVEVDRIVAFVHMTSLLTGAASLQYLNEARVPVVGTEAASPWVYDSPMYFPQATSGDPQVIAAIATAGDVGRRLGVTRLGTLTCVEAQACSRVHDLAPQHASRFGLQLVYRGQGSLAQPDFLASCQAAKASGAQILFVGFDANSIERIARSCNTIDYRPAYVTAAQAAASQLARNPLLAGLTVEMPVLPWMVTANAGIREFQAVLRRYAPAVEAGAPAVTGWVSAKLFERAVTLAPGGGSGREDVLAGLWSIRDDDLGGLSQPITFRRGETAPPTICYWPVVVRDGAYAAPDGSRRTCIR